MKARVIKTGEVVDVYHEPQHGQITNIYKESVLVNGRMWTEDELDFCVKTNVPEKIWLGKYTQSLMLSNPNSNTYVEYSLTDTFIEKAIIWISNNCYIPHSTLENFKKYMEGE